jgi:hypothetical protein
MNQGLLQFSPDGGKQKSVELTVEGQASLLRAAPYWNQAQTQLVNRFGEESWNRIMTDLNAIVEATRSSSM